LSAYGTLLLSLTKQKASRAETQEAYQKYAAIMRFRLLTRSIPCIQNENLVIGAPQKPLWRAMLILYRILQDSSRENAKILLPNTIKGLRSSDFRR
jgi:hypothetical protein